MQVADGCLLHGRIITKYVAECPGNQSADRVAESEELLATESLFPPDKFCCGGVSETARSCTGKCFPSKA